MASLQIVPVVDGGAFVVERRSDARVNCDGNSGLWAKRESKGAVDKRERDVDRAALLIAAC